MPRLTSRAYGALSGMLKCPSHRLRFESPISEASQKWWLEAVYEPFGRSDLRPKECPILSPRARRARSRPHTTTSTHLAKRSRCGSMAISPGRASSGTPVANSTLKGRLQRRRARDFPGYAWRRLRTGDHGRSDRRQQADGSKRSSSRLKTSGSTFRDSF